MTSKELDELGGLLDARRARARLALIEKDLIGYMALFSPELTYRQLDGRTIDRTRLAQDVQRQIETLENAESVPHRESLELTDIGAVEIVAQEATATASAFGGLLKREFRVLRKGRYIWKRIADEWCIAMVEILEEQVAGSRIRFSLARWPKHTPVGGSDRGPDSA